LIVEEKIKPSEMEVIHFDSRGRENKSSEMGVTTSILEGDPL
jgi:hypothetical protein